MASPHQKRVLLGLQAGLTLREVLREPHMPNERMLAEWRTDSRFDTEFTNASIQGAAYRAKQIANRPMAKGAAIASELSNQPNHPMTNDTPITAPVADDSALKETIMQRLRDGEYSHSVMASTEGFYANKLSGWRKDADFVSEWNKAKAMGRDKREADAMFIERLTTIASDAISEQPAILDEVLEAMAGPSPEPSVKANPVHDYLPEGLVRRYVILKADDCFDFLMSEQQARESAAQHSAADNMPFYIAVVAHVAVPTMSSTIHALD